MNTLNSINKSLKGGTGRFNQFFKSSIFDTKKPATNISWQVIILCLQVFYYFSVVSTKFGYMGFNANFDVIKIITGILLYAVLMYFYVLHFKQHNLMTVTWNIMLVYFFNSEMIYYWTTSNNPYFMFVTFFLLSVLAFCFNVKDRSIADSKIGIKVKNFFSQSKISKLWSNNFANVLYIVTILFSLPFLHYLPYIRIQNLLLIDIYETRQVLSKVYIPLHNYLIAPLTRVLLPLSIFYSFKQKKYKITVFFLFVFFYIFLATAVRSIFLSIFLILLLQFGDYDKKNNYILFGYAAAFLISTILYLFFGTFVFVNIIRRLMFTPVNLNEVYFNIFNGNPTFMSHSGLSFGLVPYPYDRPIVLYVGEVLFNKPGYSVNVGLLAEGFTSFNFIGGFIFALVIIGLIILVHKAKLPTQYFGLFAIYIYYFNNSMLSIMLLTHGFIFFYLVIKFLIPMISLGGQHENPDLNPSL